MNRSYRVIFNRALGVWQCVSEIAKARGKSSSKSVLAPLAVAIAVASSPAMATPVVGTVGAANDLVGAVPIPDSGIVMTPAETVIGGLNKLIIDTDEQYSGSATHKTHNSSILVASEFGSQATVSLSNGATVSMTVTDDVASWDSRFISIGHKGKGVLNVDNATVQSADSLLVGSYSRIDSNVSPTYEYSDGTVNLSNGAKLNVDKYLFVGDGGHGVLNVHSGSKVQASALGLAQGHANKGSATIDGLNSEISVKQAVLSDNSQDFFESTYYTTNSVVNVQNGGQLNVTGTESAESDYASGLTVGRAGTAVLNIDNATVNSASNVTLGNKRIVNRENLVQTAVGTVNLANKANLNANDLIVVGDGGNGTLNVNTSSLVKAREIVVGKQENAVGTINIDGIKTAEGANKTTVHASENVVITNGTISVYHDGTLSAGNSVILGEGGGDAVLNVTKGGNVNAGNIVRSPNAKSAVVHLQGDIKAMGNQGNFFAGFTANDRIEIGDGGLEFNTNGFDVTINPNAVIRYVGTKPVDEQVGFVKRGAGMLTMNIDSADFGSLLTINEGVMQIVSDTDYAMNGEELRIVLTDANNYGQLLWEGKLDVSKGKLSVKARDAVRQLINSNTATQWNDVVKATTLSGQFGQFDVVDNNGTTIQNAGINPVYEGNSVHLKLDGVTKPTQPVEPTKPVEPVTPVQPTQPVEPAQPTDPFPFHPDFPHYHAVHKTQATGLGNLAKALDTVLTADTTLGAIVNLAENAEDATKPEQNAANFVASLQPVVNAKAANIIHEQQNIATQSITDRIFNTRTSIAQGSDADGRSLFKRSEDLSNQVWIQALGYSHQLDKKDQLAGYDGSSYGTVIGVDGMLTDNLRIGGAVGYSKGDLDSVGATKQSLKSDITQGYLYADYAASEETHLNGFVSYGTSNIKTERDVTLASTTQVAKADYDSSISQAGFGIDHRIGSEHNHVSPYFQVRFTQVQTDAYAETGLSQNLSGLHYKSDKQKYHTLRHTAGVHFAKALANNVQLTGHLAGHYDQSSNDRVLMAFEGQPEQLFDANVRKAEKLAGSAGLGLRFQPSQALELGAQYSGEFRKDQQDHGAVLQLKYKF